jgi:hypothetical protein
MKIRIKMYNEWIEYRSKKTAEKEMLDGVMKTEGAERARYTYAYFAIKLGIKEINTDADEKNY